MTDWKTLRRQVVSDPLVAAELRTLPEAEIRSPRADVETTLDLIEEAARLADSGTHAPGGVLFSLEDATDLQITLARLRAVEAEGRAAQTKNNPAAGLVVGEDQ